MIKPPTIVIPSGRLSSDPVQVLNTNTRYLHDEVLRYDRPQN